MKKIILCVCSTVLFNLLSYGQLGTDIFTLGTDNADNYGGGWNTTNQGTGFSDWTFDTATPNGGFAGRVIESFSSALDVNGNSFGLFAHSSNDAESGAYVDFPKSLEEGDSFKVSVGVNLLDGLKGFQLRNSGFFSIVNFNAGGGRYTLTGFDVFFGYDPNTVITFTFTQNANTISWTAVRSGGLSDSTSGTISGVIAGSITNIRFYNVSAGTNDNDGGARNLYFNSLEFTSKYTINNNSLVSVTSDQTIPYLDIQSGSTLTINEGIGVTVSGNLNNSGNLILNSSSTTYSSIIPNTVSGSGITQYKRFTNIAGTGLTGDNDLISPPVSGQNFNVFAGNNTNLAQDGTERAFAPFDNSKVPEGDFINYTTSTTTPLEAGKGYRAATTDGSNLTFEGDLNADDISVNITQETTTYGAWNLIGNPYPSYIRLGDFILDNDGQFDSSYFGVYGYDGTAAGWTIWDKNVNQDLLIAPGQGFFVASQSNGGNVDFTTEMRRIGSSDDFIIGRQANETLAFVKILLTDTDNSYYTNLFFRDINIKGLDPGYDTGAHFGEASGIFTNLVENNSGVEMVNQSLPFSEISDIVVPLGVKSPSGVQISLKMDPGYNLPNNINVYLEDSAFNTWTLLNTNDYVFTPTVDLDGTGRFFVHFTTGTLSTEDVLLTGLQIFTDNTYRKILINGQLTKNSFATVYDLQGRIVKQQKLNSNSVKNSIDASTISSGLYVIEVKDQRRSRTQKVMIR